MYGVKKTTVYLPDELRARLKRAAEASGRSEAELIRAGVEHIVELELTPLPRAPLWSGPGNLAEHVDEILAEGFGED
jgi:CopG antitoxin of type II toxin-antitoxin system